MRESILLFHISDKEVKKKVERALLPLRVRLRHIHSKITASLSVYLQGCRT